MEMDRLEITKHLFFNLSLLMIFMVICLVWSLKRNDSFFSKTSAVICGIAAIGVCILFSYELTEMTRFDLREMPVVIGGLYIGTRGDPLGLRHRYSSVPWNRFGVLFKRLAVCSFRIYSMAYAPLVLESERNVEGRRLSWTDLYHQSVKDYSCYD